MYELDDHEAWDDHASDFVVVAGVTYVRGWLAAQVSARSSDAELRGLGLGSVRAVSGVDAAGGPVVRLRGSAAAVACVLCLARQGAGVAAGCGPAREGGCVRGVRGSGVSECGGTVGTGRSEE